MEVVGGAEAVETVRDRAAESFVAEVCVTVRGCQRGFAGLCGSLPVWCQGVRNFARELLDGLQSRVFLTMPGFVDCDSTTLSKTGKSFSRSGLEEYP